MQHKSKKTTIEEFAIVILDEKNLHLFNELIEFIKSNKLRISKTGRRLNGSWAILYNNKRIGGFFLSNNLWELRLFNLFNRIDWFGKSNNFSNELKSFILAHINTSSVCCIKKSCNSIEKINILDKFFDCRVCSCNPIIIINPEQRALEYVKELLLIGKNAINETTTNTAK